MAKSSADDLELRRACEAAVEGTKHKVVMSIRTAKTHGGSWGKPGMLGGRQQMAKPRILALCTKAKGQKTKAFLRVLKYSNGGVIEPAKLYKLKHLSKMEVVTSDPSGLTFTLGFDNIRSHGGAPQWMMRNIDDRNRILIQILNTCKDVLGRLPKVVGIDVVEMALWAKENTPSVPAPRDPQDGDGPLESDETETELKVNVEKELVSQAEEEDMEALLGIYVMGIGEAEVLSERLKRELQALEAANVHAILESEPFIDEVLQGLEAATHCVEDMDEWLSIFNVKLRHMREDIESIETRNNKLEMQSVNNQALIEALDKLLEQFHVPSEYAACLKGGSFDESRMHENLDACEWLAGALQGVEVPHIDPAFANMKAVKEKRAELERLKSAYVRRASDFLKNYFASLVDFMINDKNYFSQRGQLKRPDHADLRYKCRTYARFLQHLKSLDKNCLDPLRKVYCSSLNLLLRKEDKTSAAYEPVYSDEKARFLDEYRFDVSEVEPLVAKPHSPDNRALARECRDVKIDRVYIGSCTGGKTEDFMAAAKVFLASGKGVKVPTFLVPATQKVWMDLYTLEVPGSSGKTCSQIFEGAGCGPPASPSCAACMGGPRDTYGRLNEPQVCVSTTNRNFPGRMGHKEGQVYLASPYTAAASALTGLVTDPREFLQ